MAEVSKLQQEDKEKKNEEELTELTLIAPASLLKLKSKDWVIDKLTIKDMRALGYSYFKVLIPASKKADVVKDLQALHAKNPELLQTFLP